jgi:hypothetical protein
MRGEALHKACRGVRTPPLTQEDCKVRSHKPEAQAREFAFHFDRRFLAKAAGFPSLARRACVPFCDFAILLGFAPNFLTRCTPYRTMIRQRQKREAKID